MKVLRYQEDLRSLGLLIFSVTLLVSSLFFRPDGMSFLLWPVFLVLGILVVFSVSLLNHNHRHHPIFASKILNQILDVMISICMGSPSTRLHLVHHLNHHRHYASDKDWTNYHTHAQGRGFLRLLHYIKSAGKEVASNRKKLKAPVYLKIQEGVERIFVWAFAVFAAWTNPWIFFGVILPSWILGLLFLFVSNLFNHDLCDLRSPDQHSRNFLNPIENWIFLNNGYHSAHHAKPQMHWTALPAYHQERFQNILPDELKQGSIFLYFFKYITQGQQEKGIG